MKRGEINEQEEDEACFTSEDEEDEFSEDMAADIGSIPSDKESIPQGDALSDEVDYFPPYDLNYASPRGHPFSQTMDINEVDFEYNPEDTEKEKVIMRRDYRIISCASLASNISREEIMWLME